MFCERKSKVQKISDPSNVKQLQYELNFVQQQNEAARIKRSHIYNLAKEQ